MGIEDGTCWDEHWVLYGNQLDKKFHVKKKKHLEVQKNWVKLNFMKHQGEPCEEESSRLVGQANPA